jgi:hypothetical protein
VHTAVLDTSVWAREVSPREGVRGWWQKWRDAQALEVWETSKHGRDRSRELIAADVDETNPHQVANLGGDRASEAVLLNQPARDEHTRQRRRTRRRRKRF